MYFSEYKDNYTDGSDTINEYYSDYKGINKEIIDIIYAEGNIDINPYEGIIDSGCPKSVAGKAWMDSYIESQDNGLCNATYTLDFDTSH